MFLRLSQLFSLVAIGLLAGLYTGRWLGAPASKEYSAAVFTEVQQRVDATVGQTVPVLIMGTIVILGVTLVAIRDFRSARFAMVAVALLLVIAGTITTQVVNVPINDEINGWTIGSPPADWIETRDRWEIFHVVRAALTLLALGLVAAAFTVVQPRKSATGAGQLAPAKRAVSTPA